MPQSTTKKAKRDVFLRCDEHGRGEGFLVCSCVIDGAQVRHVLLPAESHFGIGELLCSRTKIHPQKNLLLICDECAREHGWLKRPAARPSYPQAVVA